MTTGDPPMWTGPARIWAPPPIDYASGKPVEWPIMSTATPIPDSTEKPPRGSVGVRRSSLHFWVGWISGSTCMFFVLWLSGFIK